MTTYSFVDESGETRLRGTIDPAPGGSSLPTNVAWNTDILNVYEAAEDAHAPTGVSLFQLKTLTASGLQLAARMAAYFTDALTTYNDNGDPLFESDPLANSGDGEVRIGGVAVNAAALPLAVSVPLTSANILACNNTPIELVPAPGAGKALVVSSPFIQVIDQTVGYIAASNIGVFAGGTYLWAAFTAALAFAGDQFAGVTAGQGPSTASVVENSPLVFTADVTDPTTGDGDAIVSLVYHVIDVT